MVGLGVGRGRWRQLDWTFGVVGAWSDTVGRYGVPPRATCLNARARTSCARARVYQQAGMRSTTAVCVLVCCDGWVGVSRQRQRDVQQHEKGAIRPFSSATAHARQYKVLLAVRRDCVLQRAHTRTWSQAHVHTKV